MAAARSMGTRSLLEVAEEVAESGREAGRAQLRALTFLEARYGAISAKMQTAGTLWGNCGVRVH